MVDVFELGTSSSDPEFSKTNQVTILLISFGFYLHVIQGIVCFKSSKMAGNLPKVVLNMIWSFFLNFEQHL